MKTIVLACALLTGCAMSFNSLDAGLAKLKGQNIAAAVDRLGIPAREYPVAGMKAYEWSISEPNPFTPMQTLTCTVRLTTGADDIIQRWYYSGSNGTCANYAQKL